MRSGEQWEERGMTGKKKGETPSRLEVARPKSIRIGLAGSWGLQRLSGTKRNEKGNRTGRVLGARIFPGVSHSEIR